jgi:hypothetical protein
MTPVFDFRNVNANDFGEELTKDEGETSGGVACIFRTDHLSRVFA